MGFQVFEIKSDVVTDGQYESASMPSSYHEGYISIMFYDAQGGIVTPTAGTISFHGSETGDVWGEIASVTANLVGTGVEYTRPAFAGPMRHVRATTSGIIGAVSMVISIARYS